MIEDDATFGSVTGGSDAVSVNEEMRSSMGGVPNSRQCHCDWTFGRMGVLRANPVTPARNWSDGLSVFHPGIIAASASARITGTDVTTVPLKLTRSLVVLPCHGTLLGDKFSLAPFHVAPFHGLWEEWGWYGRRRDLKFSGERAT
jgi:hypothetical protein